MVPAIELHNISKTFTERNWKTFLFRKPRYTKALSNVSLTVNKGEIMGLLGPNGAGKTTLIKILATLVTPDEGHGSISGLSLHTQSSAIRNTIGLVSTNDRTFYWRLTGRENLDFFATLHNLHGPAKDKRIKQVLQLVDMEDKAGFRFMAYSAGQKQRLSIARAMLAEPEILLLDEATASLDPLARRKLLDFIKQTLIQKEKKTIIWCTHNLNEADEICDQLTILHQGKILHSGSPRLTRTLLTQKQTYSFTVDTLHPELEKQDNFQQTSTNATPPLTFQVEIDPNDVPLLMRTLVDDAVNIFECSRIEQPLETAFSQLITQQHTTECHA